MSEAHIRACMQCSKQFTQQGTRGRLRSLCSEECRRARLKYRKGAERTARYKALREAGAHYTLAKWASNGPRTFAAALALLAAGGCSRDTPPEHYTFDATISEPQREAYRAAVDAWCDAAAYCPSEALSAERGHVWASTTFAFGSFSAFNTGDGVVFRADQPLMQDMVAFYNAALHEIAHYCIDDHVERSSLFASHVRIYDAPLSIDSYALAAWSCPPIGDANRR